MKNFLVIVFLISHIPRLALNIMDFYIPEHGNEITHINNDFDNI